MCLIQHLILEFRWMFCLILPSKGTYYVEINFLILICTNSVRLHEILIAGSTYLNYFRLLLSTAWSLGTRLIFNFVLSFKVKNL